MIRLIPLGTKIIRFQSNGREIVRTVDDAAVEIKGMRFDMNDRVLCDVIPGVPMRGKLIQVRHRYNSDGDLVQHEASIETDTRGIWTGDALTLEHSVC